MPREAAPAFPMAKETDEEKNDKKWLVMTQNYKLKPKNYR
jgi:hypothetical protein